jgi:heme exporter protein D
MLHLPMLHLSAGKYALYLWPAYGLSAVVLTALVGETLMSARRWRQAAEGRASKARS